MSPHTVALLGFSSYERSTFDSFFRLAARRKPGYLLVDEALSAAVIVANADDADTMRNLGALRPRQPVLLIGASGGGTRWPVQPRPIRLMSVLTALEQMLAPPPDPGASPPTEPQARPAPVAPPAPTPPPKDDGILVVDDSDTALHFMQARLRRFGFTAEIARSGEQALEKLAGRDFKFVFLDVMMDGIDGYQTCRAIKQGRYPGGEPPVVVMLTSRGGTIDKVKGKLAGCDAYLVKPLTERDLARVLARYETDLPPGYPPSTGRSRRSR